MCIKFKIVVYRAKIQKKYAEYKDTLRSGILKEKNCVFFFAIPFACSIFVKNKNITLWKYA